MGQNLPLVAHSPSGKRKHSHTATRYGVVYPYPAGAKHRALRMLAETGFRRCFGCRTCTAGPATDSKAAPEPCPLGREIHVDQNLHSLASIISRSSERHAA